MSFLSEAQQAAAIMAAPFLFLSICYAATAAAYHAFFDDGTP